MLKKWEYLDPSYTGDRMQNRYNEIIKQCDVFVVLFHTKVGKYTLEEFEVALDECNKRNLPLFIYFRDLREQEPSKDIKELKNHIANDLQHFWGTYDTNDKLHLDFVLWLDSFLFGIKSKLEISNGMVILGDVKVAEMTQMSFAVKNNDFQRMYQEIQEFPMKIEKLRKRTLKYPNDEEILNELQEALSEYNTLNKTFDEYQQTLLDTAKFIIERSQEQSSEQLQRAINTFESGDIAGANAILREIEFEADEFSKNFEKNREQMHKYIEALQLQAKTLKADLTTPINSIIAHVTDIYVKADDWAQSSAYDKEKYIQLLFDYAHFHYQYGHYDLAERLCLRLIALSEEVFGTEHQDTAASYNEIGVIYKAKGELEKAIEYYEKALRINEKVLGKEHSEIATNLNNIGAVYNDKGEYDMALEYYGMALLIREKVFGREHPVIATSYNNLGFVYGNKGEYDMALEYHEKALRIEEKLLGIDHLSTATSYNNIGCIYDAKGDFNKALSFFKKALEVREKRLGFNHPDTAQVYNNIGLVYSEKGDNNKAGYYYRKAIEIYEKVLGTDNVSTASSYNNIGMLYFKNAEYDMALEYHEKALAVYKKVLGTNHISTATSFNNIGLVYEKKEENGKALEYYDKAKVIYERVLGTNHQSTATIYYNIGMVFFKNGEYDKALECFEKAFEVFMNVLGEDHLSTKQAKKSLEFTKLVK